MFFRVSQGIALYPPFLGGGGGIARLCCFESTWGGGGGVSHAKAALSAIGRYRGVSQLYRRKSRFNGPLRRAPWQSSQSGVARIRSLFEMPTDSCYFPHHNLRGQKRHIPLGAPRLHL